jgi:hypothetical protein
MSRKSRPKSADMLLRQHQRIDTELGHTERLDVCASMIVMGKGWDNPDF